jgi:hypothetical protein
MKNEILTESENNRKLRVAKKKPMTFQTNFMKSSNKEMNSKLFSHITDILATECKIVLEKVISFSFTMRKHTSLIFVHWLHK